MTPGVVNGSIVIAPIDEFDSLLTDALCEKVQLAFGLLTQINPLLTDIFFAWNPNRRQYHSTPILDQLAASAPQSAIKVVGLIKMDLYIPILTYVYGEAQLQGRACIVSTFRLGESLSPCATEEIFRTRVSKEVLHELGHTFNLRHCVDPRCIMHYCRTTADVDNKSDHFCRYCKVLLSDEFKRMEKELISGPKK